MANVKLTPKAEARRMYYLANKERENAMSRARHAENRGHNLAKQKEWAAKNPGHWREPRGLPKPLRSEPEVCDICGNPQVSMFKSMCLDHDHVTGAFRGWLCNPCNRALGVFGDSLDGVMKVVQYLKTAELL